ncbi:dtdp-4-dehydrorhamnose 3,5-epimerase [hydrocarbon metagenome]|uniref:Dtdp-4-dehydrorhamnose 3,5-epimerase n=1 Tax=hydrocarbon metagenome TaxID=938273 RepID=A0A0W8G222_9ZZZZ
MSGRFEIRETSLAGLMVVRRLPRSDSRGFFERFFCAGELAPAGWTGPVAQINRTLTAHPGTLRGMHFQYPPQAEMKLVSCLRGEVFDVAVDIRAGSPTFLQWHAEILSGDNHASLLIPEGFAHGFQTRTPDVEMLYLHSAPYAPGAEGGLNPRDPRLAIAWPGAVSLISERDAAHAFLDATFQGVIL